MIRLLLAALDCEGVFVTSLDKLDIFSTSRFLNACHNILPKIQTISPSCSQDYVIHATASQLIQYPEIFYWGLEEKVTQHCRKLSFPSRHLSWCIFS